MAIYEVDGQFVCSSGGSYLVGVYETARACRMAFKTPDAVLYQIWETKMGPDGTAPEGACITEDDLRAAKREEG
jgi:hypothetical protein